MHRSIARVAASGAVAGLAAALAFTALHQVMIFDIWWSFPMMAVAGVVCGVALGVTFVVLAERPRRTRWFMYCSSFLVLLVVLGCVSLVLYEPTTTIRQLMLLPGPPDELFAEAMPLTLAFIVIAGVVVAAAFGHRWWHVFPAVFTTAIVFFLLGLNISTLGMVELSASDRWLVLELGALVFVLVVVYAGAFAVLSGHQAAPAD